MVKNKLVYVAFIVLFVSTFFGCDSECCEGTTTTTTTTIKYSVVFDANGGSGSMEKITLHNGEIQTLPECTFTPPDGYRFGWWNMKKDDSGEIFEDKCEIKDLTTTFGATIRLFAQWIKVETYTILYNDIFTADNSANPKTFTDMDNVEIKNISRTGYTFDGWFDASTDGNVVTGWSVGQKKTNITLWARWTVNTYSIEYKDKNGETFSGEHQIGYPTTHTYDTDTTLDTPTKSGFEFAGWYVTSDCSGSPITSIGESDIIADITLFAKWVIGNVQTITIVSPEYNDIDNLLSYNGITQVFTALSGYVAYYWYIDHEKQSETTNTLTIFPYMLEAGLHSVTVKVIDDEGRQFSAEYNLAIKKVI